MDNSSLDKHDLPETSEILAPFGSIAVEGSLRSQRNALTVDDGSVRSTHPVLRRNETPQRTSRRAGIGGVFQDNETGYTRQESVEYAHKGKAEVTIIKIKLDKTNDQGIVQSKKVKMSTGTDDKSTLETGIQHHKHLAAGERDARGLKESPNIPTAGGKDTSIVEPGTLVSGEPNSRTLFTSKTKIYGPSSGLVLDPGQLDPNPKPPPSLREEEVSYARKPANARVVGVRRLSEGSAPSVTDVGNPQTTDRVDITNIRYSDVSPLKISQASPVPVRDHQSPSGKGNTVHRVLDKGNTQGTQPYRLGTFVRGTHVLEPKAVNIIEAGIVHSRAEPSFVVSREIMNIDASSPASSLERVTNPRTTHMINSDTSSSHLTGRNYNTPSSTESPGTMLKDSLPVLASGVTIIQNTDSPNSASTESALKRNTTTPRNINFVNPGIFQDAGSSAKSGLVPNLTNIVQYIISSDSSAPASQRNSVASGCSYVSSVVDTQSRMDLERCSPTHSRSKWSQHNTESSRSEGLKEDYSVEMRPEILDVNDNRTVTSPTKNLKEFHSFKTDKTTDNKGSGESGTVDYVLSPGNSALSDQYYGITTTTNLTRTPTDAQKGHDRKLFEDSVPNTGTDRATKLVVKDNPYSQDRKGTKSKPREQVESSHMVDTPRSQMDQAKHTLSKSKMHSYGNDITRDLTTSKARVIKQLSHMVEIPRPQRDHSKQTSLKSEIHNNDDDEARDLTTSMTSENKQSSNTVEIPRLQTVRVKQTSQSQDYENGLTGDLSKTNKDEVGYSSPTDGTHVAQRECVHILNETEDSSGSGDETQRRRFPALERRRKDGRIEHYTGKDILFAGRVVKVKHSNMSQHQDTGETCRSTSGNREADPICDENNFRFPTAKTQTFNMPATDTRVIIGKVGKTDRAEDAGVPGNEALMDTQNTDRHPKEHRKQHVKFEYPTQSMRDAFLASKGYAGVAAPGVVGYDDNRPERSNVVGDNEVNGHQSVMDRVKSWVVSHDEATAIRDHSRDITDSPRPFDRHSIAEMPLKVLETAVPIDQDDGCPDDVFEDGIHGVRDLTDPSVGDPRYIEPREDEHPHVHHDVLIREDPEGSECLTRRRFDSLSTDPRTVYSRSLSDGFRKIEESKSEQVSIEMADLGNESDVMVTQRQSEGAIFNTSLLDGWEPSSPYAHRVKRNSSTLSEGAQPTSAGKPKVRQLSLAIGEEWEDMTGTHPVISPDGAGSAAVSQRSLRRERSQQRSWSACSTSSAPMFLGRTIRYMSHPARLENYLRRNTIPEGNEATANPPSPATTTVETVDVEERKPSQLETADDKRWLTPNPYNRINQRFHSTLQCPCYLFFCFLCCVPAVYYMQISDKEYDYGSKEKSRVYGRRATVLYVIGAISATIFLSTVTSLVVIFMQEYLTRQQT